MPKHRDKGRAPSHRPPQRRGARGAEAAADRTPRRRRLGEELRHALAELIERGDMRDPELRGVSITVTMVDVSPDLRNALAFIVPLGGGEGEKKLAAMWKELLHVERVGVHDNFFELGGQSLLAMRVVGEIHKCLAVDITPTTFFHAPTLAELSRHIASRVSAAL